MNIAAIQDSTSVETGDMKQASMQSNQGHTFYQMQNNLSLDLRGLQLENETGQQVSTLAKMMDRAKR